MARLAAASVPLLAAPFPVHAKPRLPALFADHMILQRERPIPVWGWADPGEAITIRFRDAEARTEAGSDGRWTATLPAAHPGGPDTLTVEGNSLLTVEDVLVGDVWIASGQSNMEYRLRDAADRDRIATSGRDDRLRLFQVPRATAIKPRDDLPGGAWTAGPDALAAFSAVGALFGAELLAREQVPIGIVEAAWGGTSAEAWVDAATLRRYPAAASRLAATEDATDAALRDYESYVRARKDWDAAHRATDAGTVEGRPVWAAPDLDEAGWRPLDLPRPGDAWGKDFDGFDGTVWYRRHVTVPDAFAGRPLSLHLGMPYETEQAFHDGQPIAPDPSGIAGSFVVPAGQVRAGQAVIAIRLTGAGGQIMISGGALPMQARSGNDTIPLDGAWLFRPGVDLSDFPKPSPLAPVLSFPGATVLYNGMIAPLVPYGLKGIIWYQGEADASRAATYARLFPDLIRCWRAAWRQELPFLFVQLPGFETGDVSPMPAWAMLREAQAAALALLGTGMAVAIDQGERFDIHPRHKAVVAHRLALVAARIAYGQPIEDRGPTPRAVVPDGAALRIVFDHVGGGLSGAPEGFALAGPDGTFVPARARVDGATVLVFSPDVPSPRFVRYDWTEFPPGTLASHGLPAAPFRTDAAPLTDQTP